MSDPTTAHDPSPADRDPTAELDRSAGRLRTMCSAAENAAGRGRLGLAAGLAQAAAEFAWGHHTGWYAYEPLELLLQSLGHALPPLVGRPTKEATVARGRTLHVVTQMYQTGGHTQLLARWVDEAAHRRHLVVATRQLTSPVPEKIRGRLGDRVGLLALDTCPGGLLERAARLRAIAAGADLVVCHTHPFDVVPALAFANRDRLPPVVYIDNNDHVFWVGVHAFDVVVHLRRSGQDLALRRRGLPRFRSLVRNRPLAVRRRTGDRAGAKPVWGVPADDVLMVTAADASKFGGVGRPDLFAPVEAALRAAPRLQWRIAGPDPSDPVWRGLADRTQGRARAVGRLSDVGPLHEAADLYLDSFPFSSLTSLLESGGMGNPVITYRRHPRGCEVWGADSPGVDELMLRPSSERALQEAIVGLADDDARRRALGAATARAVVDGHTGATWTHSVEDIYTTSPSAGRALLGAVLTPVRDTGAVDRLTASVQAANPFSHDESLIISSLLGALPLRDRVQMWQRLRHLGVAPLRGLAPEWALTAARSAVRLG